jgi:hypothetical protein
MERGRGRGKVGKNEGTRERWGVGEEKNKEERGEKREGRRYTQRELFYYPKRERQCTSTTINVYF